MNVKGLVQQLDAFQRERPWVAFPIAVFKKFGDDRGGYLAALVAYYGFFSLFPLLLVFVTVLGFVAENNPELQGRILNSALAQFPVIGNQIRDNVRSLHGSGVALAIGIGGALWGGMGVIQVMQNAMDGVWNVPVRRKPNLLVARLKALLMLAVLGAAVIVAAGLSGIAAAGGSFSPVLKALALAGSVAVNFGVFVVVFKVLTVEQVSWRDVAPGALVAAVAWGALQALGNYVVGHQLRNASQTYGVFAIVIGLLSWLYLGAQVTILAAEINVVRVRHLWPRSLQPPLTEAEKRALRHLAKEEERRPEEHIDVRFDARADRAERAGERQPSHAGSETQGQVTARTGGRRSERPDGGGVTRESPLPEIVREIALQTQRLLQQELRLAKTETADKLKHAAGGAGALAAAGVVALFAAMALVTGIVLALATVLPAWAAGVVGAGLVGVIGGVLALRGKRAVERATPLAPEQAIEVLASTREMVSEAWGAGSGPDRTILPPKAGPPAASPHRRTPPRF